jgi:hypothetical protein
MQDNKSSNEKKINWLSYPTQIKHIYLRLNTNKKIVSLTFDIQFKDQTIRSVFWEQMNELKTVLINIMGEEGNWYENFELDNKLIISRIEWKLEGVNFLNEEDKNQIFSFFKAKLVNFDNFYQEFKEILLFLAK